MIQTKYTKIVLIDQTTILPSQSDIFELNMFNRDGKTEISFNTTAVIVNGKTVEPYKLVLPTSSILYGITD